MPTGELDIASVPDFELSFDAAVEEAPDAIVVDLSQLTFIDSTGLRALLSMSERYKGDLGLTPVRRPSNESSTSPGRAGNCR